MQITDVRIKKITNSNYIKAVASITFDDEFVVHDIKIIKGEKGLFMGMPSRKVGEDYFHDIAHPINANTRAKIQNAIFEVYDQMMFEEESALTAFTQEFVPSIDSIEE